MIPWEQIQVRWLQGESAYAISKSLKGTPTRQAINRKAKRDGWDRCPTVSDKHLTRSFIELGNDLPENRLKVLQHLSQGVTYRLAAGVIGVSEDTLLRWRREDPEFAAQCLAARNTSLAECAQAVHKAKDRDWKAGKYLLETAKEAKGDYTPNRDPGNINVVFNIKRNDGISIDSAIEGDYEEVN